MSVLNIAVVHLSLYHVPRDWSGFSNPNREEEMEGLHDSRCSSPLSLRTLLPFYFLLSQWDNHPGWDLLTQHFQGKYG